MKQKVVALSKNEEILKWLKHYQSKNANFTEEIKSHLNEFVERVLKLNNDNLDMSKYFLAQFFRSHCKTSNGVFFKHRNSESDEILQNCQSV